MKALLSIVILVGPIAALALPDEMIPTPIPATRYDKLAQHSPFSPPTASAPAPAATPPPKAPGWADSLSIAAAMQNGPNYLVTIVDKGSSERFLASTDPSVHNARDVALTSVQWSEIPNQTQVTLRKGTEFAVVKFDASASGASSAAPPIPGAPGRPGTMPNRPPFPAPPGNPAVNGANVNGVRRNQIIRATPPPLPKLGGLAPSRPGVKNPADDDDDDD